MTTLPMQRRDHEDGSATFVLGYDESDAFNSVAQKLQQETETPTPASTDNSARDGGPIRRFTDRFSTIRASTLRRLGLHGHEMAEAVRTRRDELYRTEFPVIEPRFDSKCDECGAEYDSDIEECDECGSDVLRDPEPAEKRRAERLFESVNREGQSLRDLAKACEPDQWFTGVSVIILRYNYRVAQGSQLVDDGMAVRTGIHEIVRGDPLAVVPVVDEDGRLGGHEYACPLHRKETEPHPDTCDTCGAELRDVHFVEHRSDGETVPYFGDEVITWAYPYPKLGGVDGLAPAAEVWMRQVILDMMDRYGAAYYDPDSDSLPNQFMILHTTNPEHWEAQLNKAREDDDPYASPIFTNKFSPDAANAPEVQVIDTMPDELLGQNPQIKQDYKEDIRQAFGVSNVHDSDLSDAGGLNNEGLQLEVTDRSLASQQHDYTTGWLDELCKRVGIDDWRVTFIPATGPDAKSLEREVRVAALAARAGLDARLENGEAVIADGDIQIDAGDAGPGQLPSLGQPTPGGGEDGPDEMRPGGEGDEDDDVVPDNPFDNAADVTEQKAANEYAAACDTLLSAYDHIVKAETTEQKAEAFFDRDEDVPEFVLELIDEALANGALYDTFDEISDLARGRLSEFFREKLQQPQGWSLRSLTNDLVDEFDLDPNEAQTVARTEVKALSDTARELGYERQGISDEDAFKFLGPIDERKHASCLWVIGGDDLVEQWAGESPSTGFEGTNPKYGGSPVPLGELKSIINEAADRFVDGSSARRYAPHPNCRDTYVQHYDT